MKKYLAVIKIFFKAQLIYRFDVFMTSLGVIWRVVFAWILWGAVFTGRNIVGGFTLQQMMAYYLINSFLASMDMSGTTGAEVTNKIVAGTFSKFMVIPVNPRLYFLSQIIGTSGFYGMFTVFAAVVCALVFRINLNLTADFTKILLAAAMFILGIAFMNAFRFFIGIWAFKYQDIGFISYLLPTVISFFKGEFIPLSLLPRLLGNLLRFLPFTYVSYMPALLLMGRTGITEGMEGFGILAVWTLSITGVSNAFYHRLRIKYEGVGI